MNTKAGRVRQILTDGTGRAVIFWIILMLIWSKLQIGGINSTLIQSYLVLALPLIVGAIGVTLVIIMGQFDLSAAGVIAIVNVLVATTLSDWNPILVLVSMVILGGCIGLLNGLFVIFGKLPAIAVTLATLIILQGLAIVILPQPSGAVPPVFVDTVRLPFVGLAIIVIVIMAWMLFKRSRLGLYMFALGADPEALHLSGLPVKRIQLKIFILAGALYGLAGVLMSALIASGDGNVADSFLLTTFAAAAIGGTAFVGGRGSGVGTLFGALILTAIPKVLFVLGVSDWTQRVAFGLLILLAVIAGAFSSLRQDREQLLSARYPTPTEGEPSSATQGGKA